MTGAISFALSLAITPGVAALCRKFSLYDRWDVRKIHVERIPRLGGLSVFLSALTTIMVLLLFYPSELLTIPPAELRILLVGAVLFFALGFMDDIFAQPASLRLVLQLFFAFLLALFGLRIEWLFGTLRLNLLVSYVLTILWIVGIVNAINFIDGLDGLAAGVSAISLFAIVVISIFRGDYLFAFIGLALVGSLLGFLPFNFFPARIFLGDGGAIFLGYFLSAISILGFFKQTTLIVFLLPILLLFLPIVDTTFAVIRRMARGQAPSRADKKHIHHRLLLLLSRMVRRRAHREGIELNSSVSKLLEGSAHRTAVLILYLITAALSMLAIFLGVRTG